MLLAVLAFATSVTSYHAYMRYNNLIPHKHQVIDSYSCPFSSALVCARAQFRTNFATLVQEQPHWIALLHPAGPSRHVRPIIEDEREDEVGRLDKHLHREKLFLQSFPRFGLFRH